MEAALNFLIYIQKYFFLVCVCVWVFFSVNLKEEHRFNEQEEEQHFCWRCAVAVVKFKNK